MLQFGIAITRLLLLVISWGGEVGGGVGVGVGVYRIEVPAFQGYQNLMLCSSCIFPCS